MEDRRFKIAEQNFARLRKQFLRGEISREQFAESLRKLRLIDEQGRCWMIGAQTGKWYYYDGTNWIRSDPPEARRDLIICPACQSYNEPESKICATCGSLLIKTSEKIVCLECGQLIDSALENCPHCGAEVTKIRTQQELEQKTGEKDLSKKRIGEKELWSLRSADQLSFLFFFGGLGIFLGVLSGLIIGSTEFFPQIVAYFPLFLQEMQGKLVGGLVFSLLGGVFGFILAAIFGFLLALLINASIYFFGGPSFRLERSRKKSF